jgi:TolB-like protein/DNA-binding winged helix-turn-helix (wHTH) protein
MDSTARTRGTRFGAFEVDLRSGEVHKHGIRLKLQDQPFQVLALLLEHSGDVVTREEFRQKLWPADTFVDFDTGLNSAIKKLRDALSDSAEEPRYIQTLPRRGYRFIASVDNVSVVSPRASSEVAVHGIQINENEIQRTEISKNDGSHGTSLSTLSDSASEFIPPNTSAPVPLPSKALANTRRQQIRVGLALGIILAALAMGAVLLVSKRSPSHDLPAAIRSIAVLPLENLTGDPSQEYFADGMTDALITELAQVRGLKVISRTSTMRYKGTKKTLPEIARELGVDAIVEGTVGRSGDEVKITAQLIRASTDTHLWAASYARVRQDILPLQAEVAREVTHQISDQLVPVENKAAKPTVDAEAYDAYLKGVYFLSQGSPDAARTAIRYFQAAIEKEHNFAAAYSRLAACYSFLSSMSEMPSGEAYARGKAAAQKAVALDDNLDHAHAELAWIAILDWDWTRAENEYRRAIQINPNSADAHIGYFFLLLILGRSEESAREERAAKVLDPLSLNTLTTTVSGSYYRRQYDDGLIKARSAIELYPQVSTTHVLLSNFYAAQGNDKLAAQEILLAEETGGATPERLAALKAANEIGGSKGLRRKRIELNEKVAGKQASNEYDLAIDCAAVGDDDRAIVWLEKALHARDSKITLITVEPIFDTLRSDPRFAGFLRQMGLQQPHS